MDWSSVERTGVPASPRVVDERSSVPKGGGSLKVGKPYRIGDRWYVPRHDPTYDATGVASWYGADFHGRKTANGEIFDQGALTAAHPTLPLPSYVTVTNLANGRSMLVRVNDRGPYARDRIIDLSRRVAGLLGYEAQGTARVRVRFVGLAPLDGNDVRERSFLAAQPWASPSAVRTARTFQPGFARPSGLGAGALVDLHLPTWLPIR
jgi:rare lipoprotein A